MRRIPSPRDDGCVTGAVDFLPLRPAILAYVQDGHDADTVRFLPREPGVQSTPSHREDGCFAPTVGSCPPEQGMCIAPGPREDGRIVETVVSPRQ